MKWGHSRTTDPVAFDEDLFEFYRRAIGLRRATPALNRGEFQVLETSDAGQGIVFVRKLDDDVVIVVLNRGEKPLEATVPVGGGFRLVPLLTATGAAGDVEVKQSDGRAVVRVPALDGVVLRRVAVE